MLRVFVCAVLVLASGCAFAQQATPEVRALNFRLSVLGSQCTDYAASAFTLQDELATAKAEVKALKDKYEPKPKE